MSRILDRKTFLSRSAATALALTASGALSTLGARTSKPPRTKYDEETTAEEVTRGLNLTGKTILITGANSGLGFETARVLAGRGAHVLAAARNMDKARKAAVSIKGKVTPLACELTDFDSIAKCAEAVERMGLPLDALICNAGIMLPDRQLARGLEKQFVVNYLGHFLLAQKLVPRLRASGRGRLVLISSGLYVKAPAMGIDFDDLPAAKTYEQFRNYGQSKLAMILYADEFSRRYPDLKVTANAVYPGVINTGLFRKLEWYKQFVLDLFGWAFLFTKSVPQGAATQTFAAVHPSMEGVSGHFVADCNVIEPKGPHARNKELAGRLWRESMKLTAGYLS